MENWELQMILADNGFYIPVPMERISLDGLRDIDAEVTNKIDGLKWHRKHGFITADADEVIHDLQRARRAIRRLIRNKQ